MICVSCAAGADLAAKTRGDRAAFGKYLGKKALRTLHLRELEATNLHGVCTNPNTCTCQHRKPPAPELGEPQP